MVRRAISKRKAKRRIAPAEPTVRPYRKPPVREALIDIRIDPLPASVLSALEGLHETLSQDYPTKRTRHMWEGVWQVQGPELLTRQRAHGPIGYIFQSADEKQMVQMRLDGFTLNRLKPDPEERWPGWEVVREEARRTWEQYLAAIRPQEITRLAVRYINQIVIRTGSYIELDDFLTAPPQIPKALPYQTLAHFFSRVEIDIPNIDAKAIVTHMPARQQREGAVTIILDIDVFRHERMSLDTVNIWETLDRFRDLKNTIFEASLRERTKRLFL